MESEMTGRNASAERIEAFAGRMADVLNAGMLAVMTSIGHRTGLFDTLAKLPPSSSEAIAQSAGLQERYVREWLSAMAVGGIVDYLAETKTFALPTEHAAVLTRDASPDNVAVYAQYVPLVAQVEERILECFKSGGGVAYDHYPRFHEVMAEDSDQAIGSALFTHILPLAPALPEQLEAGISVLDRCGGRSSRAKCSPRLDLHTSTCVDSSMTR